MRCLAKAATGAAAEAYAEQMMDHLNHFYTHVPPPDHECAVTSHDGSITITYRPTGS